ELCEAAQVLQPRALDLGASKVQGLQLRQASQMLQAGVGHRDLVEIERPEPGEFAEVLDARIGDRAPAESQRVQLCQATHVLQACVRHLVAEADVERLKLGEFAQVLQARVGHWGECEGERPQRELAQVFQACRRDQGAVERQDSELGEV